MTTDTIPLIVGEIERIEASALAGASAASIGDLSYEQQCQLQSALSRLASQLRSVSDRLAALGWRPIETAPKDGSLFLCWVDAVHYGERGDDGSFDTADCSDVDFCQWRDSEHGGYFMNMMGDIGDGRNITHWMPLPAAPTGASRDD